MKQNNYQAGRITGQKANENHVDRGYREHNYKCKSLVHIAGRRKEKSKASIRKWLKRRSAVEAVIGYVKTDGRLYKNYLIGKDRDNDNINVLHSGCGYNMRKHLRVLLFCITILIQT